MGRLVGLELHNFKSYKGTTSVGFGTANFTSIIGPNGSGKSNMMDAISFVLGVRSSQLRSNQIKDLIYRGRKENLSGDSDEDVLEVEHNSDPEKAYVKAIYEKSDGTILELKRTVNSSGNSIYRINNKVQTAVEYSEVLKKENILIKARNFLVFQGDVEEIASQSAADLSKLLETISGSVSFKREYESLKEEQDHAKEETASIISKRRTLMSECKQYKEQKHEADLFKTKLDEKAEFIKILTLWKLYHIDQKRQKLLSKADQGKKNLKSLKNEISEKEKFFQSVKAKYAKESLKLSKYQKQIDNSKEELHLKKQSLLPLESQKDVTAKKITTLSRRIKDLTVDSERESEYVKGVQKQIKVVAKAKLAAEKEFNSKNQSSNVSLQDQAEYESLKQRFLSDGGALEEEALALLLNEKREVEAIISNLDTQKSASTDRVEELKNQQIELKKELTTTSSELNQLNEKLADEKHTVKALNKQNEDYLSSEFDISVKLRETLVSLDELSANQRETDRERKLRQNVSVLKRLFPGVIGLVHDLCQPKQKKYETAVSTILGKSFDSIIVENSTVAHQCISYLKEQRSGVASFIPLDSIEAKPVDSRLRHLDTRCRPTIDVVDFEPFLERAIQFACGSSVVCDDIEIARHMRWNQGIDVKVVTLDGSLIHKAGLMTGGRTKDQGRSWNKTDVQKLTKVKDDLSAKLADLQLHRPDPLEVKNLEEKILDLETEIASLRRHRSELERSILSLDAEMKFFAEDKDLLDRKQQQLSKVRDIDSKISAQEQRIESLQSGIFENFCQKLGLKTVKEYESTSGSQLKERSRELRQYDTELLRLQKKLSFEDERYQDTLQRITKIENDVSKNTTILKKLTKDIEKINDEIDSLESELELSHDEYKAFAKTIENELVETRRVEEDLNDTVIASEDLKKELQICQEDIEKYTLDRIIVLKNCKIENIDIPLKDSSLKNLPIDNNEELIGLANDVEVDFTSLPTKYKENRDKKVEDELEDKISNVTKELDLLSPNVKAIERLSEVETKLDSLENDLNIARSDELKIVKKFQNLKKKRYDTFMDSFNHISEKIDPIYKELTRSSNIALGGGSAYLTLEDEDEPYLAGVRYYAMPPMKRFKDMEFLSGGEKTIAALALLFAIHSFNPSPFFVLDEVDAALDNSNVNRIANYITKHAGPDFQFIVISLKNGLFEKSDALVGIYREQKENSSKTLTLDLRNFPQTV